jgi:hypothetical protein
MLLTDVFPYKGRSRTGTRVHLVSDRGGTACLMRGKPVDVSPLDDGVPVDASEWCSACLYDETTHLGVELKLLQIEVAAPERQRKAWAAIAEGYRQAFDILNPRDVDYERIRRSLAQANRLAQLPLTAGGDA